MTTRKSSLHHPSTLKVWSALSKISEESNFPPTLKEISERCGGMSKSVVKLHIEKLAAAQIVERIPRQSRGIRLLKKPDQKVVSKGGR